MVEGIGAIVEVAAGCGIAVGVAGFGIVVGLTGSVGPLVAGWVSPAAGVRAEQEAVSTERAMSKENSLMRSTSLLHRMKSRSPHKP